MAGCPRGTDPAQHPEPTARHRCVLLNGPCQQAVTASRALQCVARSGEPRLPPALSRAAHLLRVAFNGINAVSRLLACQLFWQWFSEVLADLHVPQKNEPAATPHPAFLYYWGYLHTGSKASRLHFAIFNAFHQLHCAPFILSHSHARPLFGHPGRWRSVSPSEQISAGQIPRSPLCAETALLLSSLQPIDPGHLQADVPLHCYSPRAHTTFSSSAPFPKLRTAVGVSESYTLKCTGPSCASRHQWGFERVLT